MGGGNSLNIIRVPSIKKFLYILYDDTLNGNIVAGNEDTWNKVRDYYNWSQVNTYDVACLYGVGYSGILYYELYYYKLNPAQAGDICVFRPIIEYKEQ